MAEAGAAARFCGHCDAPEPQLLCAQCRSAAWCSAECQLRDWLAHKGRCRERELSAAERRGWAAPPVPERPAALELTAEAAWHALPERCCVWLGGGPRREVAHWGDARWRAAVGEARPRVQGRVSVVVPTLHERYRFHAQLWLCFCSQTYVDKELIVVDSGEAPSPFFGERQNPDFRYIHVPEPLSAGEKRNLAIREHSTGEIVVNFDDDDVYFPAYIQTMVKHLRTSKAALVHLSAWNVLDVEESFCALFDPTEARPSEAEAQAQGELCGFSMVYTYAAWRSVAWPSLTSGEDRHFLHAMIESGLPVVTRAETSRSMTVLHLQHGKNMGRSVCQRARTDTGAVGAMIRRFEEACRRIINLPQAEYDQMGGSLLYQGLHGLSLTPEPPPPPGRGVFLAVDGAEGREAYEAWARSDLGLHPRRAELLRQQGDLLQRRAAEATEAAAAAAG